MKELFEKIKKALHHKASLKTTGFTWLYWLAAILYFELLLHIAAYGMPGLQFGYVLGFGAVFVFGSCASVCTVSFVFCGLACDGWSD